MEKKLLLFIVLSLFTSIANAYDFKVDDIYYVITSRTGKTCAVVNNGNYKGNYKEGSYSGDITIPANVTYEGLEYTVTALGDSALAGSTITSINLPNTITQMGKVCFSKCKYLKSFKVPAKV